MNRRGGRGYAGRRFRGRNALRIRGRGRGGNPIDPSENVTRDDARQSPPSKRRRNLNDPPTTSQSNAAKEWRDMLHGYDLYYSDHLPPQLPDPKPKIIAVANFLVRNGLLEDLSSWDDDENSDQSHVPICVQDVLRDEKCSESWPHFSDDLRNKPYDTITLWSAAAYKTVYDALLNREATGLESNAPKEIPTLSKIVVGFTSNDPVTPPSSIKSNTLGKFVTVRGAVVRTGSFRPYCLKLAFCCKLCDTELVVLQPEGRYTQPTMCHNCQTTNSNMFEPLETSPRTEMINARLIKIQDTQRADNDIGTVPRTIDCELLGALVNQCTTGDAITLSGVVKMAKETRYGGEQSLYANYIEASGITQQRDSYRTMGGHLFSFTNKDYYAIKAIHGTPNLCRLLMASLCPSIFGNEIVKVGLLLCLFGGTPQVDEFVSRRSDINMLMIGDPGMGKSQMLKIVTHVAPRAVYVCGTGSTVAGLTVTLVRDGAEYSLDAGALVLADKGVCCIDEFDKMTPQHHALLEALEQQSVTIAKAGIFRTLPARTCVIAAANPVGGHYDRHKSVNENLKINPALLSRFDLIYILLDKPNKEFDSLVTGNRGVVNEPQSSRTESEQSLPGHRFIDKMKLKKHEVLDLIPHTLLQKYIAYAKMYVHPRITSDAADLLKRYYLTMRITQRQKKDAIPVTARQLESLVRLTEARAKMELREEANENDASDAIEIFEFGKSNAIDCETAPVIEIANLPVSNSSRTPTPRFGTPSQAKKLLDRLQQVAVRQSKTLFSVDEIKTHAAELDIVTTGISPVVDMLNNAGLLLKKGPKTYQLQKE